MGKISRVFWILIVIWVIYRLYAFYPEMVGKTQEVPTQYDQERFVPSCPKCPEPTDWSECINYTQYRTTYRCDATTNYKCVEITQTRPCVPPHEAEYIQREYKWSYKGMEWTWKPVFPRSLYEYYKNKPRPLTGDYSVYVTDPYDDEIIKQLVDVFRDASRKAGFNEWETINFVISFVQSLPYVPDSVSTPFDEYPKYPIETLIDNGGDCEDTSILTAELLTKLGYSVVLIELPRHMAVGVACSNCYGTYYNYGGVKYFYLETTGEGWEIGQIPMEYREAKAIIYPLIPKPIITANWVSKVVDYGASYLVYEIHVTVTNEGSGVAKNLRVWIGFDAPEKGKVWAQKSSDPQDLKSSSVLYLNVTLSVPRGVYTRLHIVVYGDNFMPEESISEWFRT
ncbi:MAG: hypothetical protein QXO16_02325 [Archaeoglobaceae archaeon]